MRDGLDGEEGENQGAVFDLAASKLAKQANLYKLISSQTQGKRFEELATGQFAQTVGADRVEQALEEQKAVNAKIEDVVSRVKAENQDIEGILDILLQWEGASLLE